VDGYRKWLLALKPIFSATIIQMAEAGTAQVSNHLDFKTLLMAVYKVKKERKTWDKDEWREKAKAKDAEERELAKQNDELMRKGRQELIVNVPHD
jgi:hypothetical protein